MIDLLASLATLAPWLAGAVGALTGIGGVAVALMKSRTDKAKAELSHDARIAPMVLERLKRTEDRYDELDAKHASISERLDDCEKKHEDCGEALDVERVERKQERVDLEDKIATLQEMVKRRTADDTGKIELVAERVVRRSLSQPAMPINLPPPKKLDE